MHKGRLFNSLLAVVAALLILNVGLLLSAPAHALKPAQYKAIAVDGMTEAAAAQRSLNAESAQGWEYVGSVGTV